MIIKNLGPITYAEIKVSALTIFFGNNGTGKTLAQYSFYSFLDWVESNYKQLTIITEEELISMIVDGKTLTFTLEDFRESLTHQIVSQFNALDNEYFQGFFKDDNVFKENVSSITIDKDDVTSIFKQNELPGQRTFSWPFTRQSQSEDIFNTENSIEILQSNSLIVDFKDNTFQLNYGLMSRSGDSIEMKNNLSIDDRKRQVNENSTIPFKMIHNFFNEGILDTLLSSKNVYLPAERIGINTFRKVLLEQQIQTVGRLNDSKQIKHLEKLVDYPRPINSYLAFTSSMLNEDSKRKIDKTLQQHIQKLIPGDFEYDENSDSVFFNLRDGQSHLSFKLLSSSLKSLYGLEHFIEVSDHGDSLFIDEPEMNLHPEGQITVMELLYGLVKYGKNRVILSTHSDYLIKKLINLLLKDQKLKLPENPDVSIYMFKNGSATRINDITSEDGDGTMNFDSSSILLNEEYYSLMD